MIYLTRKQSIVLAIALIGIFFITLWIFSGDSKNNKTQEPIQPTPGATSESPPQSGQFSLNDFHRSEIRNGRKIWEIRAEKGQYLPDKQLAEISNARVWLYRESGKEVYLESPIAEISFDGASLHKAHFPNNVKVVYDNQITIDTTNAYYDKSSGNIYSDYPVKIVGELLEVNGNKFSANVDNNSVVISNGVMTLIKPQRKKK